MREVKLVSGSDNVTFAELSVTTSQSKSKYDAECSVDFKALIDSGDVQGVLDKLETSSSNLEKLMHAASAAEYAAESGAAAFIGPLVAIVQSSEDDGESFKYIVRQAGGNIVALECPLSIWKLGEGFKKAAANGHIDCMELLLNHGDVRDVFYVDSLKAAAKAGKIEVLEFLFGLEGRSVDDHEYSGILEEAIDSGEKDAVEFLFGRRNISDEVFNIALQSAANSGQIAILEFLFGLGINIDDSTYSSILCSAVYGGNSDTVEFILGHRDVSEEIYLQALQTAVHAKKASALEHLFDRDGDISSEVSSGASAGYPKNNFTLEHLFNRGRDISQEVYIEILKSVAETGQVQVLEFLFGLEGRSVDDEGYSRVIESAANSGQVESLKWLLEYRDVSDEVKAVARRNAFDAYDLGRAIECVEFLDGHKFVPQDYLLDAVVGGDEAFVKRLLACGADIDAPHETGQTLYNSITGTPALLVAAPEIIDLFHKIKAINDDTALCPEEKKFVKAQVFGKRMHSEGSFDKLKADAVTKAEEFLSRLDDLDSATREFVMENYIFIYQDPSEWLDIWKKGGFLDGDYMVIRGDRCFLVDLALHCGDKIDGLEDLLGKSQGAIVDFMRSVPREVANDESAGEVSSCSVKGLALRVIAEGAVEKSELPNNVFEHVMDYLPFNFIKLPCGQDTDQSSDLTGVIADES